MPAKSGSTLQERNAAVAVSDDAYNGGQQQIALSGIGAATQPPLTYAPPSQIPIGTVGAVTNPVGIYFAAADFNEDGKTDLVVSTDGLVQASDGSSAYVQLLTGNGRGGFTRTAIKQLTAPASALIAVDVNHDGHQDLIAVVPNGGSAQGYFVILLGDGKGDFQLGSTVPIPNGAPEVATGNFGGHGNVDLAIVTADTSAGRSILTVFLNSVDGNGTFTPFPSSVVPEHTFLTAGKFRGAATTDLALAVSGGNTITLELSQSDGTFKPGPSYVFNSKIVNLTAADLNGDGKTELVVSLTQKNSPLAHPRVATLIARPNGTFTWGSAVSTIIAPTSLSLADVNGDGLLDLVGVDAISARAFVFTGKGGGEFNSAVRFPTQPGSYAILPISLTKGGPADLIFLTNPAPTTNQPYLGILFQTSTVTNNPMPVLTSLSPASVLAGSAAFTLHLKGSSFVATSTVFWNGTPLPTKFISSTELDADIPAASIAAGRSVQIVVVTPTPGGGQSLTVKFDVLSPRPTLISISPRAVPPNRAATVTLAGTGFAANSVVQWNGSARPTTFVNAATLKVSLSAADLASSGTGQLTVMNPAPGGGTSSAVPLIITDLPIPTITGVTLSILQTSPACPQIEVDVAGTGFIGNYTILQVNGQSIQTFGDANSLVGYLPAGFSAGAGNVVFVAKNPSISSDPFKLPTSAPPLLALCTLPDGAEIYPSSNFLLTFLASEINTSAVPSIKAITLPAGIRTATTLPFTISSTGTRVLFRADSSVAAGNYSIPITGGAGNLAASGVISLSAKSTAPPGFFFRTSLVGELGAPIGGSGSINFYSLPNSASSAVDYAVDLSVSGLPTGTTALVTPARIVPGDSFTVTVKAATNAPVRQNVVVTVTGTPEAAVAPAATTFSLDVTQKPGSLPGNRTDFVSTSATPYAAAYDRAHDLVFVSNPSWNRIDIISNKSHILQRSIPLRGPRSLDISQDGSTVWIGTDSQQVFALDTKTFALTRYFLPGIGGVSQTPITWQNNTLLALADGTLLLNVSRNAGDGSSYNVVWTPSTNQLTTLSPSYSQYLFVLRSGNARKAYGTTADSANCHTVVYDAATKAVASLQNLNERCSFDAVNYDGSRLVASDNGQYGMYAGSLGLIGKLPVNLSTSRYSLSGGFAFSPDGNTLYQIGAGSGIGALIATIDVGTLTLKGLAPALATLPNFVSTTPGLTSVVDVDSTGMLIGLQDFGIGFDDSTFFQTYGTNVMGQTYPVSFTPNAGLIRGGTTSVPYGFYSLTPDVWYGKNRGGASVDSSNTLRVTSPAGNANGPVNLKYIYPSGVQVFTPQAFSYSTYPQYSVLSGATPTGGVPGRIAGYGMPADASGGTLTVAGRTATITTQVTQYPPYTGEAFPSTFLDYTVPAGNPGYADLQIETFIGKGILPKAVFYAKSVNDYSSTDAFSDVLYDARRKQVYLSAKDHVAVFSTTSNQFLSSLKPASRSGVSDFRGLALTPDGSQLLAANLLDGSIAVINPDDVSQTFAIAVVPATGAGTNCVQGPFSVAALANHQAFISTGIPPGIGGCNPDKSKLYIADLQARSAHLPVSSPPNGTFACANINFFTATGTTEASEDGSLAIIGTEGSTSCFYSAVTNAFVAGPSGASTSYGVSFAADGHIAAVGNSFSDPAGNRTGSVARPHVLYSDETDTPYPLNNYPPDTLQRPRLNASGSLYYWAFPNYFEIIDVSTGILRLRFSLSEKVQNVETPIAIDEGGRQVFLITDAGLTVVDLGSAPLSIGHLGPSNGSAGTKIQVRGSGFAAGATAIVGGQPANVTVVDENTLTLTLPTLSTGPKDLSISNTDGTTYTLNSAITVP